MRFTHDQPLPGDLVVKMAARESMKRSVDTFIVTMYPHPDTAAGPYQSLGYALRQARALAQKTPGVQVWREDGNGRYENVTDQ